jgi:hypothetical protein
MKTKPMSCPADSTQEVVNFKQEGASRVLCVKSTAQSYLKPLTSPPAWPCDGSDPFSIPSEGNNAKCYRSSASSSSPAQAAAQTPAQPPFATLDTNYQAQVAAYEAAMNSSIQRNDPSKLPELRTMSEGIQTTLNKMIENLTYLKKDTPDIKAERDTLLETLRRIQLDYSAMVTNTDDLETLRRIRQQETGEARRELTLYLMAFLFVCCMLLVYLVYTGRKAPTSQTAAATPTMSPALT